MKTCKIACCTISRPESLSAEEVQLAARIKRNFKELGLGAGKPRASMNWDMSVVDDLDTDLAMPPTSMEDLTPSCKLEM